jgi:uncharacterized protein involved in type VI secretion and phage assembly
MELEKVVANLAQQVEHRYYGKYRGLVVDNADKQHLGRLKLQVPSVLGPDVVTGWATPCVPYGGHANQGCLFIPEVGAGVWVEFEEGDLEFPIWVGTFWSKPGGESELPKPNDRDGKELGSASGAPKPSDTAGPEQGSGQKPPTRKIIKTARGHTIQFEDKGGEEMVTIVEAARGSVVTMDQRGVQVLDGANKHRFVMSSQGITIESKGDVTITGQTITIDAKGELIARGKTIRLN